MAFECKDTDAEIYLRQAAAEIRQLRRRLELAEARLEMVYLCNQMVQSTPPQLLPCAMSEDIAWTIERFLNRPKNPSE